MGIVNITDLNTSIDVASKPVWSVAIDGYRYILYSTNKALIFKGENKEPSYEVTSFGCSCPGDRYSDKPCKHRKQLQYLGDGSAVPPIEGTAVKVKQANKSILNTDDLDSLFG